MRTKVAVYSDRDDVDSVGACVGMKGIRIQSIVREMEGEKIDIVQYYDDKVVMAANALTPAKVKEVVPTSDGGVIAVVDNDQYSLAVGRAGHNVRLASRLCGFEIDIKTEETYQQFLTTSESRSIVDKLFSNDDLEETPLEELSDLEPRVIKMLEKAGIFSVEDLVEKSFDDLVKIEGIGDKTAQKILDILADVVDFEDEDFNDEDEDEEYQEDEKE
jgi:N utilization substance protein A